MKNLAGYKGLIFNIILFFSVHFLGLLLTKENKGHNDYQMPMYLVLFFTALLPFELKASQYVLSIEYYKMTEQQLGIWAKFSKSYFWALLLLMTLIWRTYFKMELLIMPICYKVYIYMGYEYKLLTSMEKIPVYLLGISIFIGEGVLIGYTLVPSKVEKNPFKEATARIILLLLITFFTQGFVEVFEPALRGLSPHNYLINLPFLLILFVFFYVPLRWVEIVSNLFDCNNKWQLWLFWLSVFVGMVMTLQK